MDGLYHQQYDYPPEEILSHSFFMTRTEEFYRFYRAKMLPLDAELAKLQAGGHDATPQPFVDGLAR